MNLSPIGWALRPLKNYANFSGRASRAEFWWFTLFFMIAYFILFFIGMALSAGSPAPATPSPFAVYARMGGFLAVLGIFWLVMLIPSIAVQIRRLHDTDRSGWWLGGFWLIYIAYMVSSFSMVSSMAAQAQGGAPAMGGFAAVAILGLVMLVYCIVLLVFWCLRGTPGPNRFGEDPYGANVGDVFA
jgi:uncharacterized membrane protein YhaH (DUF805 family)